jgi:hypothetical protein
MGGAASIPANFAELPEQTKAEFESKYDALISQGKTPEEAIKLLIPTDKDVQRDPSSFLKKKEASDATPDPNPAPAPAPAPLSDSPPGPDTSATHTLFAAGAPIRIHLTELVLACEMAVLMGKTPLVVDSSEDDKVNTFFTYRSVVMLDGKKMGLDKSMRNIPVPTIMEEARVKLVAALKFGYPFVIAMTKSVTDFATLWNDESANSDPDKPCLPKCMLVNAGRELLEQEWLDKLFRPEEKEGNFAFSRSPDTFCVILTTQFQEEDFEEYLFDNDWGLPKPKENYQFIVIDDNAPPLKPPEWPGNALF